MGQENKKLGVFFDGTWNRADQVSRSGEPSPTNVTKLFEATLPHDGQGRPQIVHYVQGVGTRRSERLRGGGFGLGISDNIKEGYRFLVSNYEPGDDIYIFGFSRGAFSARSLAGMIRNVGLLKREKVYLINEAYDRYRDRAESWRPDGNEAKAFRASHTWTDETIRFLGVFDTVGALGAPFGILLSWIVDKLFRCRFHDLQLSSIVQSAYHALAVDERRLPFRPTLMQPNKNHHPGNFEQRWFPGVHSNVGGGYPKTGLADTALEWMVGKVAQHGLEVDLQRVSHPGFKPDITQAPDNSQSLGCRIATVLSVKLPGCIGVVPANYRGVFGNLRWNGDYIRPIDRESLHECVARKIQMSGGHYRPPNVK